MNYYDELNKRLTAKVEFTFAAKQAQKDAQADIDAGRDGYSNKLGQLLKEMGARSHQDQIDTVRGIAKAWEDTMPEQMMRIAYQLHNLVNQTWFGAAHAGYLLDVTEKFGAFAQAHDNHEALSVARSAFRFKSWGMETLQYVLQRGVEKAVRQPKAQAPAVLRLAA